MRAYSNTGGCTYFSPSVSATNSLTRLYTRSGRKHLMTANLCWYDNFPENPLGKGTVSGASKSYHSFHSLGFVLKSLSKSLKIPARFDTHTKSFQQELIIQFTGQASETES